jgi:putative oxidoreductase
MNASPALPQSWRTQDVLVVLARWLLGGLFLYMGLSKALQPVEFLKLIREYDVLHTPLLLNSVAALLPWFEMFCGLLLLLGVAVRGAALLSVAMLVPFTVMVFLRTLEMSQASGQPLCALKFDCGCGGGEVWICRKLVENTLLTLIATWLMGTRSRRFCLRHAIR